MKTLSLIGSRLFQYLRSAKMLFFLYLFSSVVCGIGMLYLYGNFTTLMWERYTSYTEMKTFGMKFPQETEPSLDEIKTAVYELEDRLSACYAFAIDDSIQQIVVSPIWGEIPVYYIGRQVNFAEEENIAVIPAVLFGELTELDQERKTLTLKGQSMEIAGKSTSPNYIIPIKNYQQLGYPLDSIYFVLQDKPNAQTEQEIIPFLQQGFPDAEIGWPRAYQRFAQEQLPLELFLMCLVYAASLFSFAYLLKYLLDQHISENVVYSLIGASKKTVVRLIMLENLLLSSLSAVLSIGLHLLLKEGVLDKFSKSVALTYRFPDYVLLFLLMVVVSQLVSLPFILRYCKQTAAAIRNSVYTG